MFKRLIPAAAALAVAFCTPVFALAGPTDTVAISVHAASSAHATTAAAAAFPGVMHLLAQADPTGTMTNQLNKVIGIFTGGPAKILVVLAIVGTCIALLQRPDHHELIGNMSKVILIGVIILSAQAIVNFVFP